MVGVAIPVNDSVENDLAAVEQEEEPHNLAKEKQKRNQGTNELTLVTSRVVAAIVPSRLAISAILEWHISWQENRKQESR